MEKEMAAGRPTKYTKDLPDDLLKTLAAGKSVTQFAAKIGVHRATIYEWADRYPEFSDALLRGKEASQAYWEDELQNMMYSREVNAPLVKLYFANRFNWHDKAEVDNKSTDGSMKSVDRVTVEVVGDSEVGTEDKGD